MPAIIVVGAQWGDEGKGKIIDRLSLQAARVVRAQGGNNAGHTVLIGPEEYKLHLIPSGILFPDTKCYIGGGTVIDPHVLLHEMDHLMQRGITMSGRLGISKYAHVIFPYHRLWDSLIEKSKGKSAIGTTGRGIGPCYADKTNRIGIRMADLVDPIALQMALKPILEIKNREMQLIFQEKNLDFSEIYEAYKLYGERLKPFVMDVEQAVNEALDLGENILLEGAQGTFLDITFGTYPYVTSSQTIAAGICSGAGIGPTKVKHTVGVVKAYSTRVGNGPFPSEMRAEEVFFDHHEAREVGTTTGRMRRIGWFDAVLVKQAVRLNGISSIALTKLDILDTFREIKICTGYKKNDRYLDEFPCSQTDYENLLPVYETHPGWQTSTADIKSCEDLPVNAMRYVTRIQELCGVPISILSVGPQREQTHLIQDVFKEPV